MSESLEHQLEIKRVETLYDQVASTTAANLLTGLMQTFTLVGYGYTAFGLGWMVAMATVIAARYGLWRRFQVQDRENLDPAQWFRHYGIAIAVTGSLWGIAGFYAIRTSEPALTFFSIVILVGMVGGSVATCAVSVPIFLAFSLPALVPPSLALMTGVDIDLRVIGFLILLYLAIVTRSVKQIRGVIVDSFFHRYENRRLLAKLGKEKQQIEDSEHQLREAYKDLETTHQALVEQQTLTDRERIVSARLREIDRLKDEFLANTSHELRTPLYGIVGLAEAMIGGSAGSVSSEVRTNLGMIVASGRRLSHLVGDLLDFSKLRHASLDLDRRVVDLHPLVEVVLTLSKPLIGSKELELVDAIPRDLPPVAADENRLQQILHNLIGNALKFTETGTIEVSARVDGDQVVTTVSDTGIGIPERDLKRIFDAFVQSDASIEREFGGTGLGLAISRQLVELHGGKIWVESRPDSGSTFRFSLPIADETTPITAEESSTEIWAADLPMPDSVATPPVSAGITPRPGARLLIVDDEPINLQVLRGYLEVEGFEVVAASSGVEALRLIEEQSFDLVLLDVMMPRVSGHEVCRSLRSTHQLQELPVIFLTARTRDSDLVAGMALGANDYLTKPISKDRLLARIRPHLALLEVYRDLEGLVEAKMSQVKVLEGLLPICARCKKIRDDIGTWQPLETYIDSHSEAHFSHGICPDCVERYQALESETSHPDTSRKSSDK